ncbi:MAG: tetratricopeptide repeat protein [Thermomicrobiales bacterium]
MSLGRGAPGLTSPGTPLIGREDEIERVGSLLANPGTRLVSILGPGGAGKTRLALATIERIQDRYPGGVIPVALADVTTSAAALDSIAAAFGAPAREDTDPVVRIAAAAPGEQALLVLDNLEQIRNLSAPIATLLGAVPSLQILVTSRSPLRIRGERELPLDPLSVPDRAIWNDPDALRANPAVRLFVDRAEAIKPSFTLDSGNAEAIAEICTRLDGLPLAIELAAARTRLLPPETLLAKLSVSLDLLSGGARDLPQRHQTIRAAIAWSYDMLALEEQRLFRRLGCFRGGAPLDGIEAIAAVEPPIEDHFDTLANLVDQSLLRQNDAGAEPRFSMLETVATFASEALAESDEFDRVNDAHAGWIRDLVRSGAEFSGNDLRDWMARLDTERENVGAAFDWFAERGERAAAQELGAGLIRWWDAHGRSAEARRQLERALRYGPEPGETGSRALSAAAVFARRHGDFAEAERLYETALERYRAEGDELAIANTTNNLGVIALDQGRYDLARERYESALEMFERLGQETRVAAILVNLGPVARRLGEPELAAQRYQEALTIYRRLNDRLRASIVLNNLGVLAISQQDPERAAALFNEALSGFQGLNDAPGSALAFRNLGEARLDLNDLPAALAAYREALAGYVAQGGRGGAIESIEGIALCLLVGRDPIRGARLAGASALLRDAWSLERDPADQDRIDQALATARSATGRGQITNALEARARTRFRRRDCRSDG